VRLFDARTGKETLILKGPVALYDANCGPVFSPDGTLIAVASASREARVRVHDARTGQEVTALKGTDILSRPVFSPDGKCVRAYADGVLRFFDARTGQPSATLKDLPVVDAAYNPDRTRLAASSVDGSVWVY